MPRDSSGNYSLPAGNPVVGGTTITATWANPTMTDIGDELTNSLDRNGRGGMLAPFKFADGLVGAPGITWNSEPTSGFFRAGGNDMQAVIAGVPRMRWTATSVDVWDTGTSTWLPIIGPSGSNFALTNSPNNFSALSINTFAAQTYFTYSGTSAGNLAAIVMQSVQPNMLFRDTDSTLNEKVWRLVASGASWQMNTVADDGSSVAIALNITRSGVAISNIAFGNATNNPTYQFLGTGAVSIGGTLSITGSITGAITFSGTATFTANASGLATGTNFSAALPGFWFTETDVAANGQLWRTSANASVYTISTFDDARTTPKNGLAITRLLNVVTNVALGNATDNPTYSILGTGAATFGGTVIVNGAGVSVVNTDPSFQLTDSGVAANNQRWMINANGTLDFYALLDGGGSAFNPSLRFSRSGEALTSIQFGNAVNNATYTFAGTGSITSGGVFLGPAGAVGAPTYSFALDPNTGVANLSTDTLGLVAGGAERVRIGNDASPLKISCVDATGDGFIAFYESLAFSTRKAYLGFGAPTTDVFSIANEENAAMEFRTNSLVRQTIGAAGTTAFDSDATSQVLTLNSTHASGSYLTFMRNGTSKWDMGTGLAIGGSFTADSAAIAARAGFVVEFAANGSAAPHFRITTAGVSQVNDASTFREVGFRDVPRSTTVTTLVVADRGKCVAVTAAIAVPVSVFAAGDAVSIYNDSASSVNITLAAGTLRLAGTTTSASPRALAARGLATLWFNVGGATPDVICSGPGLS